MSLADSRRSGILLHPTSLPGPYGLGDLGPAAHRFVDWLGSARQQLWQVLPLNPIAHGNSPYTSPSAFAGNTLLLSLDRLREDGLLAAHDLSSTPAFAADSADFGAVYEHRKQVFARVHEAFRGEAGRPLRAGFDEFRHQARVWLGDHALFQALQRHFQFASWPLWDEEIARHEPGAVARWRDRLAADVEREEVLQFLFRRQWTALRARAAERGIRIIGDVPIFVAFDSADAWAHRMLFKLDEKGRRHVVAGVPPDYFSADGQLWGNPLYDWAAMKADGYRWWIERVRGVAAMVDILRVDHFRGFAAAWEVPAAAKTARVGAWVPGPGRELFDAIFAALGPMDVLAEDLGVITPDVEALRDALGFPGMKVLQFAFGDPEGDNLYLPYNHVRRSVVYTGTHDNDTTRGWFASLDQRTRTHVQMYLRTGGGGIASDLMAAAWGSVACAAMAPLQDLLDLGTNARLNTPGRAEGNWSWRFREEALTPALAERLAGMTVLYGRQALKVGARSPPPASAGR